VSDADQLRNRATRLLALAPKARDDGHTHYADELTQLASEAFEQATDMERRGPNPVTPAAAARAATAATAAEEEIGAARICGSARSYQRRGAVL
jgi:hypothetical protein